MPSVINAPDVLENTSRITERDDGEPLPRLLPSALRPRAYRAETALDILAREYPDLHLRAMTWFG